LVLTLDVSGNPIPEAKWVLRGRIVNNNTSPSGSNTQIYLIHELGEITLKYIVVTYVYLFDCLFVRA